MAVPDPTPTVTWAEILAGAVALYEKLAVQQPELVDTPVTPGAEVQLVVDTAIGAITLTIAVPVPLAAVQGTGGHAAFKDAQFVQVLIDPEP